MSPEVSVVIVNYNTVDYLRGCLESILSEPPATPTEMIVVDNASADGSAEMVRSEFPAVELVASDVNLGFAGGNNAGFERARGEMVFVLNPDTVVAPGCIDALAGLLRDDPQLGVVGPRLVNVAPGTMPELEPADPRPAMPEPWANRFGRLRIPLSLGRLLTRRVPADRPLAVDWVLNAAAMVRRSALDRDRLMDETFFIGTEEVELCCAHLRPRGFRFALLPSARVFHFIGRSYQDDLAANLEGYRLAQAAMHYRRAEVHSEAWARIDSVLAALDHALLALLLTVAPSRRAPATRLQRDIWLRLVRVNLGLALRGSRRSLEIDAAYRRGEGLPA